MGKTVGAVFEIIDNFTNKAKKIAGSAKEVEKHSNLATRSVKNFGDNGKKAAKGMDTLKQSAKGATDSVKNLSDNGKKAAKGMDTLKQSAKGATDSVKNFDNNGSTVVKGIDNLKRKIIGLGSSYINLKSVSRLASTAIGEASSLEQYRNTLNVVMKDSKKAGETMQWAVGFANKTPFETNEVVQGVVKLQSYGLAAKDVMADIGDMSAVMGKSLNQGVEAIADAQTGELARLKEFGITKQMIVDHGNKTMKGKQLVNSKGQIVDQKNFNKALFSLMKERYKGGMEMQSKTFKGTMSTVTGVAKNALAQLMGVSSDGTIKVGGLFDKLKGKAMSLSNKLQKWSTDGTIQGATKKIEEGFNKAGDAVRWVKDNLNWLIPITTGVVGAIVTLKIINGVRTMMDLWRASTLAQTIAQGGLNAVLAANPIGVVIIIIGALVAAGVALYMHWDTVKAKAKALWSSLTSTFENIKNSIIEKWNAIKDAMKHPIKGAISVVKGMVKKGDKEEADAGVDGVYANGLNRVPHDGHIGKLHKDEMVLTKNQADRYRKGEGSSSKKINNNNFTININGSNMSPDEVANALVPKLKLALSNM